jgi:hypothetical protein
MSYTMHLWAWGKLEEMWGSIDLRIFEATMLAKLEIVTTYFSYFDQVEHADEHE